METLFPSNGTYQVRTLVNGNSLEDCSIIRANDKIRPYFAVSVAGDPDLIGLLIYLQDSHGKIFGDRVQYTLLPYADEDALTEEDFQEEMERGEAEPNEADEAVIEADDEPQILQRWSFTDAKPLEKNNDIEVAVKSLAAELPYFLLPKELEIGPYVLVFEALGKRDTLSRTETDVYYLDSAEFNLKDIAMYMSGLSGSQLISPGTVVMLETSLDFDSRLDPYVIWYNGKSIIGEGKISDGAGQLLWQAPEQAGFYSLRLEAFPFRLSRAAYPGLSREIALPVSPKAISLSHFFKDKDDEETPAGGIPAGLLQWYQFEGGLRDSLSAQDDEQTLLPANKSRPRWSAAGQSYGLAIGPDDPYLLSPINFFRKEKDQGGGILLFHIRPLSEGVIFSAFFPLESSPAEGVWMDMIKKGNTIALRLSAADTFVDLPVYLPPAATEGLIPIAVEFYIRPYQMEAKISLNENLQNKVGGIGLSDALSGEGNIRLGGGAEAALPALTLEEEINAHNPAPVETFLPNTVWDELAILLSSVPLLPGKLPAAPVAAVNIETAAVQDIPMPDSYEAEEAASDDSADFIDNSIEEQEMQERGAQERLPTVLSENS